MKSSITSSPAPRAIKASHSSGQPNGAQGTGTHAGEKEPLSAYGPQIAQTALLSVGLSTRDLKGTRMSTLEYAEVVSIIFTKATNQAIMLGTEPRHVLSTSLLRTSLLHDKRFRQVPMSEATPGDIILESTGYQASGYAGIVVDHGRIVSMGRAGIVQDNSSLLEIQSTRQSMALFRYVGVQRRPTYPLANAGYNDNEPRLPKGQPGGGQWTSGSLGIARGTRQSVYDSRKKARHCAGDGIVDDEDSEPGFREEKDKERAVDNFHEPTQLEQEQRDNDAQAERKAKQIIEDRAAEAKGQTPARKPPSIFERIRQAFGLSPEEQQKKDNAPEPSQQKPTERSNVNADRKSGGRGSANENTKNASVKGSSLHSDKPGNLPDQLRDMYPDTNLKFTKPGTRGQDVKVVGGTHPSEYPDSNWEPGVDHGDFKPDTRGGTKAFNRDKQTKWVEPTQKLPYDPNTGKLK